MKLEFKNIKTNAVSAMRSVGYAFQRQEGDEMSFIRLFSASGYPRFHAYVSMNGFDLIINVHFDAKKETYGKNTRHHGEYEDEGMLKEEAERLRKVLG